jgi:AraC family transcriptional activator FtrA
VHNKTANYQADSAALAPAGPADRLTAAADLRRHRAVLIAYDGLAMFEFGVALDIFGTDWSSEFGRPWYEFEVCTASPPGVTVEGGYQLQVPLGLDALRGADTVLVPPTDTAGLVPEQVRQALREAHRSGARIVSLCTGAFVLADAGLLAGRRATTHWAECATLARRHPDVRLDPAVLYVDDGDIMTSAGSAASIDLCLHLVRQDFGAQVASSLARQLVVPPYRDGGQAQYIDTPLPIADGADLFADTLAWMQAHLELPLTVDDLATRSAMSRRTFARRFAAATGTTPYQWLLRQRLQRAQRLLETTDLPVDSIAQRTGFSTAANLRKHFGRQVRTTPQAYRYTFRSRDPAPAEVRPRSRPRASG